jgi:hypothetical protein
MSETGEHLALIVGHYKSGSTWLLNALSLHPTVRGIHETHIFHHSSHAANAADCTRMLCTKVPWANGGLRCLLRYRFERRFLRPWRPALALRPHERPACLLDLSFADQIALRRELLRISPPDDYCRAFFEFMLARLHPPRYLLEKTPDNIFHVDRIVRLFPEVKLLAIHRDGRDVVVSDRFFQQRYRRSPGWSLHASARAWRDTMQAQIQAAERHHIFLCSYEAFRRDGEQVLRSALDFLDLPSDPGVVSDMLRRSSFRFHTGRNPGEEDRKRFARKGVSGDWRQDFTEADKRAFKEIAGEMLVELGYERDLDW